MKIYNKDFVLCSNLKYAV